MVLCDDVQNLRTVSQQTLDHLQHVVSEAWDTQLLYKHLQPLLCRKLTAALLVALDHGRQHLVQHVVDLGGHRVALDTAFLPRLHNHVECQQQHPLPLEEFLSLSQFAQLCLP